MKKETLPKGVIHGLLFNIGICIFFTVLVLNYFYPEYLSIEEKKQTLNTLQNTNNELLTKGLKYSEFLKMFRKKKNDNSDYLNNIFKNSDNNIESLYTRNLINEGKGNYKTFIDKKIKEIKESELDVKNSQIQKKINKILPYYKNNASLEGEGLTDFKFINYIEKIIYKFGLEYKGNIGVGTFVSEENDSFTNKKKNKNQLKGEIYSFKLPLSLIGKKKNIIDFIYYLENVGSIKFSEKTDKNSKDKKTTIEILKVNTNKYITDENGNIIRANDFNKIRRYFLPEKDIFNNIICEIESIKFPDYIDSGIDPIPYTEEKTFLGTIKKNQADEKFEIDIVLKFYVKGLELYKTKKYIKDVIEKYNKLSHDINLIVINGKKEKNSLNFKELFHLKELEKYNFYLKSIKKDIEKLSDNKKLEDNIGNVYKEAQSFDSILNKITNILNNTGKKEVKNKDNKKIKINTKDNNKENK